MYPHILAYSCFQEWYAKGIEFARVCINHFLREEPKVVVKATVKQRERYKPYNLYQNRPRLTFLTQVESI